MKHCRCVNLCSGNKDDPTEALGPLPGLEGFTGVANIMGYPGRAGVFTVPRPIIDKGLIRLAAVEQPSYLGYIAERPGAPHISVVAYTAVTPILGEPAGYNSSRHPLSAFAVHIVQVAMLLLGDGRLQSMVVCSAGLSIRIYFVLVTLTPAGQDGVPELVIAFRGSSSAWADW